MFRVLTLLICTGFLVGCSAEPQTGKVGFELSDLNADVTITVDGDPIKVITIREPFEFPVGKHLLVVEGDAYERIEETIEIRAGEHFDYRIELVAKRSDSRLRHAPDLQPADPAQWVTDSELIATSESESPAPETRTLPGVAAEEVGEKSLSSPGATADDQSNLTARELEHIEWVESVGGIIVKHGRGFEVIFPRGATVADEDFKRFRDLPNLVSLFMSDHRFWNNLDGPELSDEAILQLSGLPKLAIIGFHGAGITDRSLRHLAKFPITQMALEDTSITDEGLFDFRKHSLKVVWFENCSGLTDQGCMQLDLSSAQWLHINRIPITDRFVATLASSKNLSRVNLTDSQVTGAGLQSLGRIDGLNFLYMNRTMVRDRDLAYLHNGNKLIALGLSETGISASGLQYVASNFHSLKDLGATGLALSTDDVIDWSGLPQLDRLLFAGNHIGNRQLKSLEALKKLGRLSISLNAEFFHGDRSGIESFFRALPECAINRMGAFQLLSELP